MDDDRAPAHGAVVKASRFTSSVAVKDAPRWARRSLAYAEVHAATRRWPAHTVLVASRDEEHIEPIVFNDGKTKPIDPDPDEDGLHREYDWGPPCVTPTTLAGFEAYCRIPRDRIKQVEGLTKGALGFVCAVRARYDPILRTMPWREVFVTELRPPEGFRPPEAKDWRIYVMDLQDSTVAGGRPRFVARRVPTIRVESKHVFVSDRGREVRLVRSTLLQRGSAHSYADFREVDHYFRETALDDEPVLSDCPRIELAQVMN